jgi:membrane protein YdbS with pleckstrin-like domain
VVTNPAFAVPERVTVSQTDSALPLDRLPVVLAPGAQLMKYYALSSLLVGPFFPLALVPLYFRYRTLRYDVDDEGITMRWGILFRREVSLTYARIQDIHLTSNVVERWLGLARVQVQTASASATAEMTIEGLPQVERMRDFLYARMRGARYAGEAAVDGADATGAAPASAAVGAAGGAHDAELAATLNLIAAELRALRATLEARAVAAGGDAARSLGAGGRDG